MILRATGGNGSVRIFVANTTLLVNRIVNIHYCSPVVTAALGRLSTAAAMMGVMQKADNEQVTLKIEGDGPVGKIMAVANADGTVKCYALHPSEDCPLKENGKLDVSGIIGNGFLTVIKDMGLKEPYVGTTALQTGEIAEDLTYYFAASEQVPSSVGLGVLVDVDHSVKCAGGFIVQLMPFADEEIIKKLENNLSAVSSVTGLMENGLGPEDILAMLMKDMDYEIVDRADVKYRCGCSREKVSNALVSLGKEELDNMIKEDKDIEVHCDFCNTYYKFSPDQLTLLKNS